MARVECDIEDTLVEVDGRMRPGVSVVCGRCDNCVEVPGEDNALTRSKAVAKLRRTCPEEANHRYVFPEQEDLRESFHITACDD